METNEIFEEGGEGNFVADGAWIPEEHKAEESLKPITNFNDLVKGYVNAQKTIGKKGVIIPGEGASEEEIGAFHKSLGRPDNPADYEFAKAELPEGMVADEKIEGVFRDIAHKNGLSNATASAIVAGINKHMIDSYKSNNESIQADQIATKASLDKIWGKDAEANMELASRAFKTFVPDKAKQEMFGKLGDNPVLIEAFLAIGKAMSEDKLAGGDGVGVGVDAQKAIEKIKLDPKHPFNIANDPGHDAAVKEMQTLYMQAYPGKKPDIA